MLITIVKDFFSFIKGKTETTVNHRNNVLWIIAGYLLLLGTTVLLAIIKTILSKLNLLTSTVGGGLPDNWIAETSLLTFAIQVAILAPILEEFSFRGVLLNNRKVVICSLVILIFVVACRISDTGFYTISIKSSIIFVVDLILVLILQKTIVPPIIKFTTNNIKWLIYLSSLCFAIWHYNNFNFSQANIISVIFSFSPYFLHGLVFCWISNRKGLQASLLLHFINNALPVLIAISKHGS